MDNVFFFFSEFDTKHCLHLFVESSNERKILLIYLLITSFDGLYIKVYFNLPTFKWLIVNFELFKKSKIMKVRDIISVEGANVLWSCQGQITWEASRLPIPLPPKEGRGLEHFEI